MLGQQRLCRLWRQLVRAAVHSSHDALQRCRPHCWQRLFLLEFCMLQRACFSVGLGSFMHSRIFSLSSASAALDSSAEAGTRLVVLAA